MLDTWLTPLKKLKRDYKAKLETIKDASATLNVVAGVATLLNNVVVEEAVRERDFQVHGVVFGISSSKLRDLGDGNGKTNFDSGDAKVVRRNHGMLVFGGQGATMETR